MRRFLALLLGLAACLPLEASITESHGYAQFGILRYPASFRHFDWVNPDAPKGGSIRVMGSGSFDTLNPYPLKGTSPGATANLWQYGISEINAPLMVGSGPWDPSGDEPASSYGLVAESVEYSEDRSWVVFNLRSKARFHDGQPITAADVAFSWRKLSTEGHPSYRTALQEVARVDVLNPQRVRFVFKRSGNPLLILRIGELPVLPAHWWRDRNFQASSFEPPLGSGPYRITQVVPGRRLVYERVTDWWGQDLPVSRGKYNFDRVEVEFYRDNGVAFEAFKAGEFDFYIENQAKNWASGYDFPAVQEGEIQRAEIPHQIPTQTQALFMNTRRSQFADVRVREALSLLFDFEWSNATLFSNAYRRTDSYYPNSEFSARGLPQGEEWLLLSPFRPQLPGAIFTRAPQMPATDGHGLPRETLRRALSLLAEAGWKPAGHQLVNARGQVLSFEILLANPGLERILQPYRDNLQRIGILARLRTVDRAQYKQRIDGFDYDMVLMTLPQTLSPGLEQWQYFHSSQAGVRGSRNYAGISDPVVDALLERLLASQTRDQQVAAARAIDRVLLAGHYSILNWYSDYHRLAWRNRFASKTTPPYTLGLRAWWIKEDTR